MLEAIVDLDLVWNCPATVRPPSTIRFLPICFGGVVEMLNVELGDDLADVVKIAGRIERLGQPAFEITYTPAFDYPRQLQVLLLGQHVRYALLERALPLLDAHLNKRVDLRHCVRFFRSGWCRNQRLWIGVGNALAGAILRRFENYFTWVASLFWTTRRNTAASWPFRPTPVCAGLRRLT